MTRGLLFWVLMILWLVLGLYTGYASFHSGGYAVVGGNLLEFILFTLLGWNVFGPAVKG